MRITREAKAWLTVVSIVAATVGLGAAVSDGGFGPAQGGGTTGGGSSPTNSNLATVMANTPNAGHTGGTALTVDTGDKILLPAGTSSAPSLAFTTETTLGRYRIGSGVQGDTGVLRVGDFAGNGYAQVTGSTTGGDFELFSWAASAGISQNLLRFAFRRGTQASPTNAASGDYLGSVTAVGTTNGSISAAFSFLASASAGTNTIPTDLVISVTDAAGSNVAATEAFRFSAGSVFRGIASSKAIIGPTGSTNNGMIDVVADGAAADFVATAYGTGFSAAYRGRAARGTFSAPTASQAGDLGLSLSARFYGATGFAGSARGRFGIYAAQAQTDAAQGTYLSFETTPNGSTTMATRWAVNQDGSLVATSGLVFGFSSSSTDPTVAPDTAMARGGSGVTVFTLGSGTTATGEGSAAAFRSGVAAGKTSDFTVDATATLWKVDATSGSVNATLPTAVGITGRVYVVKRVASDVSANTVTVLTTSAQTIDGGASYPLTNGGDSLTVISDGSNWVVI